MANRTLRAQRAWGNEVVGDIAAAVVRECANPERGWVVVVSWVWSFLAVWLR